MTDVSSIVFLSTLAILAVLGVAVMFVFVSSAKSPEVGSGERKAAQKLEELADQLKILLIQRRLDPDKEAGLHRQHSNLLRIGPRGAVMKVWSELDTAAFATARAVGGELSQPAGRRGAAARILSEDYHEVYRCLEHIRDCACGLPCDAVSYRVGFLYLAGADALMEQFRTATGGAALFESQRPAPVKIGAKSPGGKLANSHA